MRTTQQHREARKVPGLYLLKELDSILPSWTYSSWQGFSEAADYQNWVEAELRRYGYRVEREWEILRQYGTWHGFVDLVVTSPVFAAIELDRSTARKRSIGKLQGLKIPGWRIIITRTPPKRVLTWYSEDGHVY